MDNIHTSNTTGIPLPRYTTPTALSSAFTQPSAHPLHIPLHNIPPGLWQFCRLSGAQSELQGTNKTLYTGQVNASLSSNQFMHIDFLNHLIHVPVEMTHQDKEWHQQLELHCLLNLCLLKDCQSDCNNTDRIKQRNNNTQRSQLQLLLTFYKAIAVHVQALSLLQGIHSDGKPLWIIIYK